MIKATKSAEASPHFKSGWAKKIVPGQVSLGLHNKPGSINWKAIHINVQSLQNKIPQLEMIFGQEHPNIFIITEHWMSQTQAMSVNIPGLNPVSVFCRCKHRHGGVAIYSSDNNVKPINLARFSIEFSF